MNVIYNGREAQEIRDSTWKILTRYNIEDQKVKQVQEAWSELSDLIDDAKSQGYEDLEGTGTACVYGGFAAKVLSLACVVVVVACGAAAVATMNLWFFLAGAGGFLAGCTFASISAACAVPSNKYREIRAAAKNAVDSMDNFEKLQENLEGSPVTNQFTYDSLRPPTEIMRSWIKEEGSA